MPINAQDVHPIGTLLRSRTERSKVFGNVRPQMALKVSSFPEGFITATLYAWVVDSSHLKKCNLRYKRLCESSWENAGDEGVAVDFEDRMQCLREQRNS